MDKKGPKNALKVAQSGTPVPQKDFSSKKKEAKAADGSSKGSMAVANNLPMPSTNASPTGIKVTEPKKTWEGSPEDWSKDYSESRRKGMKVSDYEDTASDRISDSAGEKRMRDDEHKELSHGSSYKQGVSAFSNSPKTSHGFGHPSSARDGHLRNSGHPQAHRIGKKK